MGDAEYEWAAELLEEGRTEGEAKGRAEGEAKGRAEGEAKGRAMGRAEGEAKGRAEGEAKGRAEGEAKGRAEGILLTARNMIAHDQKDSFIATITGLQLADVQALRAEMPR